MTEEEKKAQEEAKAKAEAEAKAKEEADKKAREEAEAKAKAEKEKAEAEEKARIDKLVEQIKEESRTNLAKVKADYEKRLDEREKVIIQLMNGNANKPTNSIIDNINKKREAQIKKW